MSFVFESGKRLAASAAAVATLLVAPLAGATPWEAYLKLPTPHNARQVRSIEYSSGISEPVGAEDLKVLERQVIALDPDAFELTYRLSLATNPGALQEALLGILAGPLRGNPEFFLAQASRLDRSCKSFARALNATGLEYVDRSDAQSYEMGRRREALTTVTNAPFVNVKRNCLALLPARDSGGRSEYVAR
jgi:hypothetical protein